MGCCDSKLEAPEVPKASKPQSAAPAASGGPIFKLGDGKPIPAIGFGTYQIENEDAADVVKTALKVGYRQIDTAEHYGNEEGVGKGIKESGIPRKEIFITSKLQPGGMWGSPIKYYDESMASIEKSCKLLGVDFIDLYLVHAPSGRKEGRLAQWKAMVEAQRRGLLKSIGVSNFSVKHLKELEEAGLPAPSCNELELHPNHQHKDEIDYMKSKGILAIAYSSLAPMSGWRANSPLKGSKAESPSELPALAERAGMSEGELLLCYGLQRGWCILPKSLNEKRMKQNLAVGGLKISPEIMTKLNGMPQGPPRAWGSGDNAMDPTNSESFS